MLFHVLEALSNIERNWVARRDFYKLLILDICAYVVNNSLQVHSYWNLQSYL